MIRRVVMWRIQGKTAAERRAGSERVRDAFESLRGRIPGMTRLEVGLDSSTVPDACDVVLLSDFVSRGALAAYAVHPELRRVQGELGDLQLERHQVEYALIEEP